MKMYLTFGIIATAAIMLALAPVAAFAANPHENPKETTTETKEKRNAQNSQDEEAGQTETTTTTTEESCTNKGGKTPGGQEPSGGDCKGGGIQHDSKIISEDCTVSTKGNPNVKDC